MKAPSRTLIIVLAAAPLAVLAGCGSSGTNTPECHQPDRHRLRTAAHRHRGAGRKAGAGGLEPRAQGLRAARRWAPASSPTSRTPAATRRSRCPTPARWCSRSTSRSWRARCWPARTPRWPRTSARSTSRWTTWPSARPTQLTSDARYGNALSSGWLCDQPDVIAADYLYQDLGYRHVTVLANDYAFGWLSAGGFIKQFTMLGGKIDKELWPPLTTTDYGPYVSAIPKTTQAVFAETLGPGRSTSPRRTRSSACAGRSRCTATPRSSTTRCCPARCRPTCSATRWPRSTATASTPRRTTRSPACSSRPTTCSPVTTPRRATCTPNWSWPR